MKKILFTLIMTVPLTGFAQEGQKSFKEDPFNHPLFPLLVAFTLFAMIVVLACVVILYITRILDALTTQIRKEKAEKLGQVYIPHPTFWERFSQRMNASVAVADEEKIELDHSYDGIKELDNHLPPWWKYLFYGTIAWSVIYIVVFHFSDTLPLQTEEYQAELTLAEEQAQRFKASQPQEEINVEKLVYNADPMFIEQGKAVFIDNNCGACHRGDGGGNTIGPNLTDTYWIHGGKVQEVFTTIKNGVIEKGMPAWGKSLSPQKVRDVTFFILSLQGSSPENAKAPQGIEVDMTMKADSVKRAEL